MLTAQGSGPVIAGPDLSVIAVGQSMKKIEIIRATVCAGAVVSVGDIVDAPDRDADFLIAIGKAREAVSEPLRDTRTPDPVALGRVDAQDASSRRSGRSRKVGA